MRYIMSVRDNCCGAGIYSKKYHEAVGEDEFNFNTMGSGRYKVVQHTADDIIEAEAVPNHWKENGEWEIVRALEVPEQLTRVALVKANQADVSDMSMALLGPGDRRSDSEAGAGVAGREQRCPDTPGRQLADHVLEELGYAGRSSAGAGKPLGGQP